MVRCYEGNLGMGKTMNMVYDLMQKMKKGRVVISNTPIAFCTSNKKLTEKKGGEHDFYKPCPYKRRHLKAKYFEDHKDFYKAFMEATNEIIAIDEAGIFFNRRFTKIPVQVFIKLVQSRKMSVDFYYTAQSFRMLEGTFKTITNEVYQCKKYCPFGLFRLPKLSLFPLRLRFCVEGRVFVARICDPVFVLKGYTASGRTGKNFKLKYRKLFPRQFRPAMNAYDTLKIINMMPVGYRREDDIKAVQDDKVIEPVQLQHRLVRQESIN